MAVRRYRAAGRGHVVVEDYADTVIDSSNLGRDWAPVLRWAIALDDGRLVFAAEGGLELA
ncbi:hypothetical protein LRL17_30230 (plasmid) [Rhodococcus qingshengii]|uniref:hypothetical protein n=1 Tax=Rhodococcus qingshengii TaxID=334542 RepID=UPI001E2A524A|nr:hypothetical protein [Rhodococcus qingshengii]UGQ55266.1 hypothetical protein LRL17_30230 [Rhodococcus qingshengii]